MRNLKTSSYCGSGYTGRYVTLLYTGIQVYNEVPSASSKVGKGDFRTVSRRAANGTVEPRPAAKTTATPTSSMASSTHETMGGAAPSLLFDRASGQPESAPSKISSKANSGTAPIKATSPDTTYCQYLGSLITTLDRVAGMPKLLAVTGNKCVDDTSATRSGIQITTSTLISSMKIIFAPRLMILTV